MTRRSIIAACFLAGATLLLAAAPALGADAQPQPVRLGMSGAFTGPSRGLGIELYRGAMAYFQLVNQQGGLFGRPVQIVPKDDRYEPDPAVRNTIQFIRDRGVLLLFNYVGTPTTTRVLPLLRKYDAENAFLLFPFTGARPLREPPYDKYVFNLRASYFQETEGLVDHLADIGRRRISVFHQADAYGRSGWAGVRRALQRRSLSIASEATYRRGAKFDESMARQADIIMAAEPEAVIAVGAYEACAAFIRDARDAGLDAPIANLSFVGSENLLALLERAGAQAGADYTRRLINTQVAPSYEDLDLPAVREYRELMSAFDPGPPPGVDAAGYVPLAYSFVSFEGFLNAKALTAVIRNFGRVPARGEIPKAVESVGLLDLGLDVPVRFGPGRRQGLQKVYFTTVQDGRFAPIEDWERWAR